MPVIIVTGHGDIPLAVEAIRSGAIDFLEKPFDGNTLLGALRSALVHHREEILGCAERSHIRARIEALSGRERQVLEGLVAGHPNKIIACDLGISIRTIEVYRANVMTKMQASSLPDLVRMAITAGFSKPRKSAVARTARHLANIKRGARRRTPRSDMAGYAVPDPCLAPLTLTSEPRTHNARRSFPNH